MLIVIVVDSRSACGKSAAAFFLLGTGDGDNRGISHVLGDSAL